MRFITALFASVVCIISAAPAAKADVPASVAEEEATRIETIEKVSGAVVAIFPPSGKGGGSGVLISPDGLTLTNFHVVDGAGPFLKCGLKDGVLYDAVLIGIDPTGDVAMIQMLGREDFPYAPLGDSDTVHVGDWTFAMGNPFLLAEDFVPTLTYGMVSGVQRYQYPAGTFLEYTDCIQVDTSINPGNSGGPLFNEQGEVVGINGRISVEKRGRVNAGAGYAISINQIKNFSDHLLSGRVVDHATLGATVRTDEFSNVVFDEIKPKSNADFCGIQPGDEIVSFGGRVIGSVNQFKNVLGIYPKGWKVPLIYRRDGERYEVAVQLEALHSQAELLEFAKGEAPQADPKIPIPNLPHMEKAPEIPEEYANLYESRMGYPNYRFNRIKQEELLAQFKTMGKYGTADEKWAISGKLDSGEPYRLVLAEFACLLELAQTERVYLLDLGRPESLLAGPENSGMLMALFEFYQLMIHGDEIFSEIYYVGSEPLDGQGERVDILATTHGDRTHRWYFSKQSKMLVGWDVKTTLDAPTLGVRIPQWQSGEFARPLAFKIVLPGKPDVTYQIEEMAIESVEKLNPEVGS